jgi:hypothetical protein
LANQHDRGLQWTTRKLPLPLGSSVKVKRVRWLASGFVAVGERIFTSPDGITWIERQSGVTAMLNDVAWSGDQFAAVGDRGTVLTSVDGSTWTPRAIPPDASLSGVATSGSRFVAVGRQHMSATGAEVAAMLTSTDGITWEPVSQTFSARLTSVNWSGTQFAAVGSALPSPNAGAVALVSPDGMTWTSHAIGGSELSVLNELAWNGSQYVTVGHKGAARSPDGISWKVNEAVAKRFFGGVEMEDMNEAIAWSGYRFLVCAGRSCRSSTDGVQWSFVVLPADTWARGLAWGADKWVAVGAPSLVLTSP